MKSYNQYMVDKPDFYITRPLIKQSFTFIIIIIIINMKQLISRQDFSDLQPYNCFWLIVTMDRINSAVIKKPIVTPSKCKNLNFPLT